MEENADFVPTNQTTEVPVQPQMKKSFCKYCGTEVQPGIAFCPSCGKPQGNVPAQQNAQAPQQHMQQPAQQPYAAGVYQQPVANSSQTTSTTVIVEGGRSNGLGTAGFVLAILAFFVCWIPVVDFVVWFLGALFSFIGVFKRPRGLAIAGLIISFIGIIILITFFGALIGFAGR